MIEDQAAMARAALALHEATGSAAYLATAERLANAARDAFADGHGGFYTTAADATDVPLTRPRAAADNVTPSGNGMMAEVLARLYHLTGDPGWRARTEAVLTAFSGQPDQLAHMPTLLAAADLLEEAATIVIVGSGRRRRPAAGGPVRRPTRPSVLSCIRAPPPCPADHPAFGKTAGATGAAAYVCRRGICGLPIADPAGPRPGVAHAGLIGGLLSKLTLSAV